MGILVHGKGVNVLLLHRRRQISVEDINSRRYVIDRGSYKEDLYFFLMTLNPVYCYY